MRVSVIGTGYLGATHAACLAACGHEVLGVDASAERVERRRSGSAPFHEPGLDALLRRAVHSGARRFSTDPRAVAGADVHFLCVGTPQRAGSHAADLSALDAAVAAPVALTAAVRQPRVSDGRLALDPDKWRAAGRDFHALGRGTR